LRAFVVGGVDVNTMRDLLARRLRTALEHLVRVRVRLRLSALPSST